MITKWITAYGQNVEMCSLDGRAWFTTEAKALEFQNRVIDVPQLTPKQKEWLDLVELPTAHCDMRASLRINGGR